jgi:LCP family protein required for cell wall assembly
MKIKNLGVIFYSLLMVGLLAGSIFLVRQYYQPLGPAMTLSSANIAPAAQVAPTPTPSSSQAAASAPAPFCGQTGKMVILVVGDDTGSNIYPPGSDLVRYVQVNFDQQKITIFTFPRDLWLKTLTLADQKIDATTIGKTYHFAMQAAQAKATDSDEKKQVVLAAQAVAQTVLDNFGLKPDHYVAVKLSNLPKLVDAVGGVTINNPTRIETPYNPPFIFEVGPQTLNGLQTTSYVRFADYTHTDSERITRQNLVLQSLYKKLEDPANLAKIPTFFTQLADSVVTDLSAENVTDLTCMLKSVGEDHVFQERVQPDMVTAGPEAGSQLPDLARIIELLRSLGLLS